MKFDVVTNAPCAPRTFPVAVLVAGVPCIQVSTLDIAALPSETVRVFRATGGTTAVHETPEGPVQEVKVGDFIGVCSKQAADGPTTLNAFCIAAIDGNQVVTTNTIL